MILSFFNPIAILFMLALVWCVVSAIREAINDAARRERLLMETLAVPSMRLADIADLHKVTRRKPNVWRTSPERRNPAKLEI